MHNLAHPATARLLGLALLLATAASCHKSDDNPTPSRTALLTGPTWRYVDSRVTINGVEGVYTPTASGISDDKYAADGKYTSTAVSGSTTRTGTWAWLSNETQLALTPTSGTAPTPYDVAALTSTDLALGYTYTQAQVQQALNNNNTTPTATDREIRNLVFSLSYFVFPGGTPPVSSSAQITSLALKYNFKAH